MSCREVRAKWIGRLVEPDSVEADERLDDLWAAVKEAAKVELEVERLRQEIADGLCKILEVGEGNCVCDGCLKDGAIREWNKATAENERLKAHVAELDEECSMQCGYSTGLEIENDRLKAELELRPTCACQIEEVEPCTKRCTCRWPHFSGGCRRCASYGSKDQQAEAAKAIAAQQARIEALEKGLRKELTVVHGAMCGDHPFGLRCNPICRRLTALLGEERK